MTPAVQTAKGASTPTEFPPAPPDEPLYEVVNGRRVEVPSMSAYTILVTSYLHEQMGPFARANRLGISAPEGLFILDPVTDLRRRPDVAFVSAERWPLDREVPEEGDWEVVPDLAIEVISPNELFQAALGKVREYLQYKVRQVWLVIPSEKLVYVYDAVTTVRIVAGPDPLETPLLPGLRLDLARLFSRRPQ